MDTEEECIKPVEMFNVIKHLLNKTKKDTQKHILLNIFLDMPYGSQISKRDIELKFGLRVSLKNIDLKQLGEELFKCKNNEDVFNYLVNKLDPLPGDLQRTIRLFYEHYKDYGLKQIGSNSTLHYYWEPISQEKYEIINNTIIVSRHIFKNEIDKKLFIESKNGKCEICESNQRLAIDHWRAHSIYKIDSIDIAVLLCETCNNIHHNFDASKILKHKKNDYLCIKKWIEIEKKIRKLGYMPNEEDKKTQNEMINLVISFWKENDLPINEELLTLIH